MVGDYVLAIARQVLFACLASPVDNSRPLKGSSQCEGALQVIFPCDWYGMDWICTTESMFCPFMRNMGDSAPVLLLLCLYS